MHDIPGGGNRVDRREARDLPYPMFEWEMGSLAVTLHSASVEGG